MNELYHSTDLQVSQVHHTFFVIISREILKHFSLIVLLNFQSRKILLRFLSNGAQLVFGRLYYRIPGLYLRFTRSSFF